MKWLIVSSAVFLFVTFCALARADELPLELGISPNLSFGTGAAHPVARFSLGGFLKVPVAKRWQLKAGGDSLISDGGSHQFSAGVDHNFSDEWRSAFFAGGGIGWHRLRPRNSDVGKSTWFGYVEAGKRFTLVHSWGLSYAPQVQVDWVNGGQVDLKIMPANFSWMF